MLPLAGSPESARPTTREGEADGSAPSPTPAPDDDAEALADVDAPGVGEVAAGEALPTAAVLAEVPGVEADDVRGVDEPVAGDEGDEGVDVRVGLGDEDAGRLGDGDGLALGVRTTSPQPALG